MKKMNVVIIFILISGPLLLVLAGNSFAEDAIPFENDTRETATVLELGSREDSISMMDYFDYYVIEADYIDDYKLMALTVKFIDVPGSGFIEVRTYLSERERDYAYLDRENTSKRFSFDSNRTSHMDLYVEISGYGNYSIQLQGEEGSGQVCWICDLFGMVMIAPLCLTTLLIAAIKRHKRSNGITVG